ncbi:MAG: pentapeptide repeat-containing protein [Cyanobacteria bacterium J06638_22]
MANSLWRFLNTPIHKLISLDTVDGAIDTVEAIDTLAEALEDEQVQEIAPWVEQGAALLDVLNTPEAELAESLLPFAKIATGLLKFYLKKSQTQLTFADCVVLVSLKAYGESLKGFLPTTTPEAGNGQKKIDAPNSLNEFALTDSDAKNALLCFHKSELATHLKTLMVGRLKAAGFAEADAQRLTERAAWNTHRYITEAWGELPEAAQRFGTTTLADWREEQEKYTSIDTYLTEYISPKPEDLKRKRLWQVFNESFTLQELYVPLQAQLLDRNFEEKEYQTPADLETWALKFLKDPDKQDQVLFIQAGPGRGKSVFCRIFANKIREHFSPTWIPILIRLRDIPKLQNSFADTLRNAVSANFTKDEGWLTSRNTRFLFLLDGFDELLMEGRTSGGLEQFLRQVGQFQRDCTSPEMGHRFIVTGRPLALHGIEPALPQNLVRVKLLPMDDAEQACWLEKWSALIQADPKDLQALLNDSSLPDRVRELAREPLVLYLLAAMHRDGELHVEMFAGVEGAKAKVLIYQKTLNWVLTKQRPDGLNRDLTELGTDALYRILAEAGLCVVQSGDECASIRMLEERLKTDEEAKDLLETAQAKLHDNPLRNALAAFYLQPGRRGEGSVEFAHKSFSEFLCAERIKQAVEAWTYREWRNNYEISDEQLYWELYDLLGAPVLTKEIVEYLFELLQSSDDFKPVELFDRLHTFYIRWCNHEFMNAQPTEEHLPQKKLRKLQAFNINTGLRQVDVFTGLNVLIFLFKLHAVAQYRDYPNLPEGASPAIINFHPCDNPDSELFVQDRLLKIIHYTDSLGFGTFTKTVGPHIARANLDRANLNRANLNSTNLNRANLNRANLDSANLARANLNRANFNSANLDSANLTSANLDSANLTSANLTNAYLDSTYLNSANLDSANLDSAYLNSANFDRANLNSANLANANLASANFYSANLSSIKWNSDTDWENENIEGMETARNIPIELKRQLGLEE